MSVDFKEFNRKMDKTLEVLQENFGAIRAGRANARVLDRITVEYYGVETPVGQVGSISSPDARTLVIQPWDGSLLKKIEKAIQTSELGINPQNDGKNYIVTSGLKPGDRYVSKGITSLNDGMEIKPITEEQYLKKIDDAAKLGEKQGSASGFVDVMKK